MKKSVGNNVKEALHNVLLLFAFLPGFSLRFSVMLSKCQIIKMDMFVVILQS